MQGTQGPFLQDAWGPWEWGLGPAVTPTRAPPLLRTHTLGTPTRPTDLRALTQHMALLLLASGQGVAMGSGHHPLGKATWRRALRLQAFGGLLHWDFLPGLGQHTSCLPASCPLVRTSPSLHRHRPGPAPWDRSSRQPCPLEEVHWSAQPEAYVPSPQLRLPLWPPPRQLCPQVTPGGL